MDELADYKCAIKRIFYFQALFQNQSWQWRCSSAAGTETENVDWTLISSANQSPEEKSPLCFFSFHISIHALVSWADMFVSTGVFPPVAGRASFRGKADMMWARREAPPLFWKWIMSKLQEIMLENKNAPNQATFENDTEGSEVYNPHRCLKYFWLF